MFEVKVNSEKLLKQFDDMQKRVADLDQKLPEVFLDWQREDMNRKFPKVDERGALSVTTLVYPRSRTKRVRLKGARNKGKPLRRVAVSLHRPILRPVLVEKLFNRMIEMCKEAIAWR